MLFNVKINLIKIKILFKNLVQMKILKDIRQGWIKPNIKKHKILRFIKFKSTMI